MPKSKASLSTHAARNPTKAVQQPRRRANQSSATKATKALAAAQRAQAKDALFADIDEHYHEKRQLIKDLAIKHNKKENYIKKLLNNDVHTKTRRSENLWNAVVHDLSMKAKEAGDESALEVVRDGLSKEEYQKIKDNMSEDEKTRLLKQLASKRKVEFKGIRATNKSLAMDAMQTANSIHDQLIDLFERTGVRAFTMFTRSHAEDSAVPNIVDSDNAREFFKQVFGKSFSDFVRKFEQWSCTLDKDDDGRNDVQSVCKQIVLQILDGLRKIKNNRKLAMEYVNYRSDIVHKLGVELAGWPSKITFASPIKLSADQAREIRDGLRSGAIHWVALTPSQREEVAKEINEGPVRKRKPRNDQGRPRGPREGNSDAESSDSDSSSDSSSDEEEEEEPMPRQRRSATTSTSRNKAPAPTTSAGSNSGPPAPMPSISNATAPAVCELNAPVRMAPTSTDSNTTALVARERNAPIRMAPTSTAPAVRELNVPMCIPPTPTAFNTTAPAAHEPNAPASTVFNVPAMNTAQGLWSDPVSVVYPSTTSNVAAQAPDLVIGGASANTYNFDFDFGLMPTNGLVLPNGGVDLGNGGLDAYGMPPLSNSRLMDGSGAYGMPPLPNSALMDGSGDFTEIGNRISSFRDLYRMSPLPDPLLDGGAHIINTNGGFGAFSGFGGLVPVSSANPMDCGADNDAALTASVNTAFGNAAAASGPAAAILFEATNIEQAAPKKTKRKNNSAGEPPAAKKPRKRRSDKDQPRGSYKKRAVDAGKKTTAATV
ncbi:hypothetical protein DFH07DRAFT_971051 [Mycena maculata]|uniref:Uncharacterized protein n=1 Tax=Mycena maculata TaxID=230809 RepID=A0AAD7HNZ6_9AGAR|nr:hypothetical protein DFH07DRAFT_971051 [Mycena maculata]